MNNITKALTYLLIMSLLLAGGGFYYHMTEEKPVDNTPKVNPAPQTNDDGEFISQARLVATNAINEYNAGNKEAAVYCNVEGCASGLDGIAEGYSYNVAVNENGKVIRLFVTNGVYQFVYSGDDLDPQSINISTKISDIDPSEAITIKPDMQ